MKFEIRNSKPETNSKFEIQNTRRVSHHRVTEDTETRRQGDRERGRRGDQKTNCSPCLPVSVSPGLRVSRSPCLAVSLSRCPRCLFTPLVPPPRSQASAWERTSRSSASRTLKRLKLVVVGSSW